MQVKIIPLNYFTILEEQLSGQVNMQVKINRNKIIKE
jgi:hypothetical protein